MRRLLLLAAFAVLVPSAPAQTPSYWKIELGPPRRVEATLIVDIKRPAATVSDWIIVAPILPVLPRQTDVSSVFEPYPGKPVADDGRRHQPVMETHVKTGNDVHLQKELEIRVVHRATVYPRRLVKVAEPVKPVPVLSATERAAYLASDKHCDFGGRPFAGWLAANGLKIGQESDIDFAHRVLTAIRKDFTYHYPSPDPFTAANLLKAKQFDCGGASSMFVWTMRANGVPARTIVGRWLATQLETKDSQTHVKAEFFARGVGWVPVEANGAMAETKQPIDNFLGKDGGDFLVMHLDGDMLVDTIFFGKQEIECMQGVSWWWRGQGSDKGESYRERWVVQPLVGNKVPALVSLESFDEKTKHVRVKAAFAEVAETPEATDKRRGSFYLFPGLSDAKLVSLQPLDRKTFLRRAPAGRIRVMEDDGTDGFRQDATFRRVPGLADKSWASFESVSTPGAYLRHKNAALWVERGDNSKSFAESATFRVADPLSRP